LKWTPEGREQAMDEASGQLRETRRLDLRCRAAIAPNRPY
jgi:hypothetical protein